ncbi:MAG: hypothetical protein AAF411_13840 [Myxococcota bacterium]
MIRLRDAALGALLLGYGGLIGCERCEDRAIETHVLVHVPHPALVPRHCTGASDSTCRQADRVEGLTYAFDFESHIDGGLWCSFPPLAGVIRTPSCEPVGLPAPEASGEMHVELPGCDLESLDAPQVGDRCEVRSRERVQHDSCGEGLFCRARDSRCTRLPERCERDFDCREVQTCDDAGLCVRFACAGGACVWPDECLDTSDCQRSHSRCSERGCDTFTCETGRCVGVAPRGR